MARAAADCARVAIAVTDRAGKLVCASDIYGEWFPNYPAPPSLPLDQGGAERQLAELIRNLDLARRALDAAETIMAHAYAEVVRAE